MAQTEEVFSELPAGQFESVAMKVAIDNGFNCYSKPVGMPDEVDSEGNRTFYFKWHGKVLAVIVKKKL